MKIQNIKRIFLFLSLSLVVLFSCKKEDLKCKPYWDFDCLVWVNSDCHESFAAQPSGDANVISTGNQYQFPVYNPNNTYEFICYKIVKDSGSTIEIDHQLIKYNLLTSQESILLTSMEISGHIAWNKNGWIAFKPSQEPFIHIVRDDGTDFTKFSDYPTGNFEFNLTWLDNNNNTLLWGGLDVNAQNFLKSKSVGDSAEKLMDIDDAYFNKDFTISSKNIMLSPVDQDQQLYYVTNLNQAHLSTTNIQYNLQTGFMFGRANWHVDGDRFYVGYYENNASAGFYEINYKTGAITKLIELCHAGIIKGAVCSPNGKHLILQKVEREATVTGSAISIYDVLTENYSLWLFDPVTRKEARIFN
jgi:hypothetical protein